MKGAPDLDILTVRCRPFKESGLSSFGDLVFI